MASSLITNTAAANAKATPSTSRAGIADNFNTFLLLLTTQLQNQSPLEPLDTNQFTEQLVQFAGVEQQIQTNDTLSALLSLSDSNKVTSAVNFIGKSVSASGASSQLTGGKAEWRITVDQPAPKSHIAVLDSEGNEVFATNTGLTQGASSFTWDGRTSTGATAPDGFYTVQVTARNASNQQVAASTAFSGTVDGVDLSGQEPVLTIGTLRVKLNEVTSVSKI
jgi:flagellar basal-body rod modification protein FlgD